jgi:hypothetical protein
LGGNLYASREALFLQGSGNAATRRCVMPSDADIREATPPRPPREDPPRPTPPIDEPNDDPDEEDDEDEDEC